MTTPTSATLRELLTPGAGVLMPGAANALAARFVQGSGFPIVHLTGAGVANSWLGAPDMGLTTATETLAHLARQGSLHGIEDSLMGFGERQAMVDFARWSALERRYAES